MNKNRIDLIKNSTLLYACCFVLFSCANTEKKKTTDELEPTQISDDFDAGQHRGIDAKLTLESEESKDISLEKVNRLANGVIANNSNFQDGEWLSFQDDKVIIQYEWDELQYISAIDFRMRNNFNEGIYTPRSISFRLSKDGKTFPNGSRISRFDITQEVITKTLEFGKPKYAKYLRIEIVTYGKIKEGLPKAGEQAWTYLDEFMIL